MTIITSPDPGEEGSPGGYMVFPHPAQVRAGWRADLR